jgi:alginate O-acetyltransferase complex protein AlgJ
MRRSSTRSSEPGGSRGPGARGAAAILLIALLCAGASASIFDRGLVSVPGRATVLDGSWTAAWQSGFESSLPLRGGAIGLWTMLRYGLFREARPEVLIGSGGWLFSSEEFDPPDSLSVPLAKAVDRIAFTRDLLSAKGIGLVIALVPTKASVQREHLGRYVIPPELQTRYADALGLLRARGITAPDLLGPLRAGAVTADMYLRTDTHWTPRGARLAAVAVASSVAPLLDARGSPREPFVTASGAEREVAGDLLKFIPLGPWQRRGPAPDVVAQTTTTAEEGRVTPEELFGGLEIPVALVGTSYSVNAVSGFEGALKDAMDADVLNVAEEGKGPFAPMDAYLGSPAIDDPRPDVVVWEIPERYLAPNM